MSDALEEQASDILAENLTFRDGRAPETRKHPFKTQPCRFFQTNTCKKGDQCTYLHEKSSAPPQRERRIEGEWHTGDWECRKCKAHNFSKRTTCFKCETDNAPVERRGGPGIRGVKQAEDELFEAENLLKAAQGEANPHSISAAEEAIGRARMALKRARDKDMDYNRDRRGPPPRDYRRPRSRSPPRYGFRDESPLRRYYEQSPPRGYREHWDRPERSERAWGPDGGPPWRDPRGGPPPLHHANGSSLVPPLSTGRSRLPDQDLLPNNIYGPPSDSQSSSTQGRWEEAVAENGDKYYWHTITKETRWTDPRVTVPPLPSLTPAPVSTWDVAADQNGDKYYWNTVTGETSWDKPAGFVEKQPSSMSSTARTPQYQPHQYQSVPESSQSLRGIRRIGI